MRLICPVNYVHDQGRLIWGDMRHSLWLGVCALLFPLQGHAQTFEQALAMAYGHDPGLQAERAKLRAADEAVPQALSNWRPDLEASGNAGRDKENIEGFNYPVLDPRGVKVSVLQPVFRGFRTVGSVDSAEAAVQAGRAELIDAEQQLLLDAAKAYLDVLEGQDILDLDRKNEEDLQKQLVITRERLNIGELGKTDVDQAQSRLEVAKATRLQAEGELLNKKRTYARLIGEMPGTLMPVDITLEKPSSEEEAITLAQHNNPKVIAAGYHKEAAHADVTVAEGNLLPEVSVEGSAARARDQNVTIPQRNDSFVVMAKMTIPLYRSGADYAKSRAAIQTADQRNMEMEDALNKAREVSANAWQALTTAREVIRVNKVAVTATDKALYGVKQEATVGTRTTLDVLNAHQELLNSRISLVKAEHDEKIAMLELKAATGTLTAEAMHLPVTAYDPAEHYKRVRNKWIGLGG